MKARVSLLAVTMVIVLIGTLVSSVLAEQNDDDLEAELNIFFFKGGSSFPIGYYGSNYDPNDNVIYTDNGNGNLFITVRMSQVDSRSGQNTVQTFSDQLNNVTYIATWQNNQTMVLLPPSDFTLTNIPYGNHLLQVNASCVYNILDSWKPLSSHPLYKYTIDGLNFTVAPVITPTPVPIHAVITMNLNMEQVIIVAIVIVVAIITIISYIMYKKSKANS